MNTVTLASLKLSVQQRGGYESSQDITSSILVAYLNEAFAELYDLVVQKWADYYTVLSNNLQFIGDLAGNGTALAVSGGIVTLTDDGAGVFRTEMVGSRVTVTGTTGSLNNGTFRITSVPSAFTLTYANDRAPAFTGDFAFSVKGSNAIALPADFYKLRKVEVQGSGDAWHRLYPHDLEATDNVTSSALGGRAFRYRVQAGNLMLSPDPGPTGPTVRIYYIPFAPRLSSDADTLDGFNQYEELIVQLALLRCKRREELDTSDIEREVERLSQRIRVSADARDAEPFYLSPDGPPMGYGSGSDDEWGY